MTNTDILLLFIAILIGVVFGIIMSRRSILRNKIIADKEVEKELLDAI